MLLEHLAGTGQFRSNRSDSSSSDEEPLQVRPRRIPSDDDISMNDFDISLVPSFLSVLSLDDSNDFSDLAN